MRPMPSGAGFFRPTRLRDRERRRVAGRARRHRHGRDPRRRLPPAFRARRAIGNSTSGMRQDGISGNALATLKERGLIRALRAHRAPCRQLRRSAALGTADARDRVGRPAVRGQPTVAGPARTRVRPRSASRRQRRRHRAIFASAGRDAMQRLRLLVPLPAGARTFLAIGGVEKRKNTIAILEAFRIVNGRHPATRLVIAGGASLLDHDAYQAEFAAALAASGLPQRSRDSHRSAAPGADARRSTAPRMRWCFPRSRKASASSCWRRWRAACRW